MILRTSSRLKAAAHVLAAFFVVLIAAPASAQSLSVLPVNIFFSPGQTATTLTITNSGQSETAVQIRAYDWSQKDGNDRLVDSAEVLLSPPLARIAPGASQIVRLILRHQPKDHEATYRILVDQIPPPSEAGVVHLVLRLSIPIFATPPIRCIPDVQFHIESDAGQFYLVAMNDGKLHEAVRDVELTANDGRKLKVESNALPYVLSGATRRWHIAAQDSQPLQIEALRLRAHMNAGAIDQQVHVVVAR